jgi:hypothetical protein
MVHNHDGFQGPEQKEAQLLGATSAQDSGTGLIILAPSANPAKL